MGRPCPFCAEAVDDAAATCPACGSEISKTCPFCAESIPVIALVCSLCRSNLSHPTGDVARAPTPEEVRRRDSVGEERGVLVTVLIGFMTLGFYGFLVLLQQGKDIQRHGGRGVNPQRDAVLAAVSWVATLGLAPLWLYYVLYRYPKALTATCIDEEIPCRDIMTPCLLLAIITSSSMLSIVAVVPGIFCIGLACPLWVISVALLQHELNNHWHVHRQLR